MSLKKHSVAFVSGGKTYFIQDHMNGCRDHSNGFYSKAETGPPLNKAHSQVGIDRPRSRMGVSGWKITKRKHQGKGFG